MLSTTPPGSDGRRQLNDTELTPEQVAAVQARRAGARRRVIRTSWPGHCRLSAGIPACRRSGMCQDLAELRREGERKGLSHKNMADCTGTDRAKQSASW